MLAKSLPLISQGIVKLLRSLSFYDILLLINALQFSVSATISNSHSHQKDVDMELLEDVEELVELYFLVLLPKALRIYQGGGLKLW